MSNKKLWNVVHYFTVDGGFGDAIPSEEVVATIYATDEEAYEFVEKYDNPYVYDHPYADLVCHGVELVEIVPVDVNDLDEKKLEKDLHSPDYTWNPEWEEED